MPPSLVFSYTEGALIAAKLRDQYEDTSYVRVGISFPLDREKYKSTFQPTEKYVSWQLLDMLMDLNTVDPGRKFAVRKADVCYGNSVRFVDTEKMKGIEAVELMREPIEESADVTLDELRVLCDSLSKKYKEVSFYGPNSSYLSAAINYNPSSKKFGSSLDVLDIEIPKTSLGCRIEFILPEELYGTEKIEQPFNTVAKIVGFDKKLGQLEQLHKEFLELKEKSRLRPAKKIVKRITV